MTAKRAWLLLLFFASSARAEVRIGSKRFTESYVLAEIAVHELEREGVRATHAQGLGGTVIVWEALEGGSIDAYPEYTGTIAEAILHDPSLRDLGALRAALEPRGVRVTDPLGFANDYALVVVEGAPRTKDVRSISDLRARPELVLGLSNELLGRSDGWPGLSKAYGLERAPLGMDHGLAYDALRAGSIDVTDAYTTDAKLARYALRPLVDDKHFFPSYEAVYLYRASLAPAAVKALRALAGSIDRERMVALNAEAEIDERAFSDVGARFVAERHHDAAVAARSRDGFVAGTLAVLRSEGPRHVLLVALSLALATLLGVPLGIFARGSARLGAIVLAVTGALQTIPSLAMLAFFVPLLGIGFWPALVALLAYALLPIVRNTLVGLEEVPLVLREVAEVMGLSRWERLRHVELPLASRTIVAGIKTSAVIGVGTATIAAFVGAGGFGAPISTGLNLGDATLILEGAVPAAGLALIVQGLFSLLERALVPRGLRARE